MATEFKLNYTGSEINQKLSEVGTIKSNLENNYYTSTDIDIKFAENDSKFDKVNEDINTKIGEVNSSLNEMNSSFAESLEAKADIVEGKIPVEQIPDGIVDLSGYYTKTEIDEEISSVSDRVNSGLTLKADLVDGKVPTDQLPDDIGEISWEDVQDKPFYVSGYKAAWNGDLGSIKDMNDELEAILGVVLYRIGDPISEDELVGGTAIITTVDGYEESVIVPPELIINMSEAGGYLIMDISSGAVYGGVTFVDNDVFDLSMFMEGLSVTFSTAGLWVVHDGSQYVSSITTSDYACKQLDPRVIPANLDFDLSNYYTKFEMNDLIKYIDGVKKDINIVLDEIGKMIGE